MGIDLVHALGTSVKHMRQQLYLHHVVIQLLGRKDRPGRQRIRFKLKHNVLGKPNIFGKTQSLTLDQLASMPHARHRAAHSRKTAAPDQ